MSARDRIRTFFEDNVGVVVTTHQISEIAGIRDYPRRIRELRDEEGMQIRSHVDRHHLRPGEYILETLERLPATARGISPQLRTLVLERDGYTCQLCGAGAGDPDPFNSSRKVRLHVDHIIPISQSGTNDPHNLRTVCSACNQGRSNIQAPSETARNLIARIRKAPRSVQREVFNALKRTFEPE